MRMLTDHHLFAGLEVVESDFEQVKRSHQPSARLVAFELDFEEFTCSLRRYHSERAAQADERRELRMMAFPFRDGLPLEDVEFEDYNDAIESVQRTLDPRKTQRR